MIIRAKTFTSWMQHNFCRQTLKDIAQHGADKGYAGLIYYHDTCKLYSRFNEEIWEMLGDDADNFGQSPLQLIASFNSANTVCSAVTFENLLTWYAAERTARQLTDF